MPKPHRLLFNLIIGVLLALAVATAGAQSDYPRRSVRLVLPFPAGGGIDLVARPLAEKLTEALGQAVVVDNMGGANGIVAMQHVAGAPPDGHTIILALSSQIVVNPALYGKLPYDSLKDFAPVALIGATPYLLVAAPKVPIENMRDFLARAKARPGAINYASSGNGSGAHLSMEIIKSMTGINVIHVPYKATSNGVKDVMAGEVELMFVTIGTVRNQIQAGLLKAVAVTGAKRSPAVPNVPTIAESGLPGYESVVWYAVLAPAGTPQPVVARLNAEILKIVRGPEYQQRLAREAVEVSGSSPEELQAYTRSELVKWAKIVKDSGAKVD
jgi:tripartite-type tricarboxylate transporter receptor subunit TctC